MTREGATPCPTCGSMVSGKKKSDAWQIDMAALFAYSIVFFSFASTYSEKTPPLDCFDWTLLLASLVYLGFCFRDFARKSLGRSEGK